MSKPEYNFLVVAALQEELNAFYNVNGGLSKPKLIDNNTSEVSFQLKNKIVRVLTFATDSMGMPINAGRYYEYSPHT